MSLKEAERAVRESCRDEAIVTRFLSTWSLAEKILEAFSQATELPIFVYVSDLQVFQSSIETMPPFCGVMLKNISTRRMCVEDGRLRAKGVKAQSRRGLQLCHAGMLNVRREIETGFGPSIQVLFGSRRSLDPEAVERRQSVQDSVSARDQALGLALSDANNEAHSSSAITASEIELMDAIAEILKRLFEVTVSFHSLAINMAHELALILLGTGWLMRMIEATLTNPDEATRADDLYSLVGNCGHVLSESQLGLYIVRNFLSHASETRYSEVVRPQFALVNLEGILRRIASLHSRTATRKEVQIVVSETLSLPTIPVFEEELARAFHNVLSNAVKYSYHSIQSGSTQRREIRIWSKNPYDPGFRERRFAILFQNYGLGLSDDELTKVGTPGFRGQQAVAEVPVGSGIGLSEVRKIMAAHGGEMKFSSRQLHVDREGKPTYLTEVALIFPYRATAKV